MASYSTILVAVVLVVMVTMFVKLQHLNSELQEHVVKHETMKKSLQENVRFCEQRSANFQADLGRETAAKVEIYKQKTEAEQAVGRLEKQIKKMEVEANTTKAQHEANMFSLQTNYDNDQVKLKEALINVQALTKERDDAKKEVLKYHDLYIEGNKLLNAARQQCATDKALSGKQTDTQVSNGQGSKGEVVVVKEVMTTEQNPPQTDVQQQDNSTSRMTGKLPEQDQGRNEANKEKSVNNAGGGVKEIHSEEKNTDKGENGKKIVAKRDMQEVAERKSGEKKTDSMKGKAREERGRPRR